MPPDAPTVCPVCGAAMSHDAPRVGDLRARIFNCGATVCDLAKGEWEVTLYCDKTGDLLRQLRADNVRIGDRNVLLATELQAIADTVTEVWGDGLAYASREKLEKAIRDIDDLATEARHEAWVRRIQLDKAQAEVVLQENKG